MPDITYHNFDLLFEQVQDAYQIRVLDSPMGEAKATFELPFEEAELKSFRWLSSRLYRQVKLKVSVKSQSSQPLTPQVFGTRLFDAVFSNQAGTCLRRSLDQVAHRSTDTHKAGLRIRLRFDPSASELAYLPWEFLYDTVARRFTVLSEERVIARYMELPQPTKQLQVTPPLRVLAVVSAPRDVAPLDVEKEWNNLQKALSGLQDKGRVTLEKLDEATIQALDDRLSQNDVHILHFIGHGYPGGLIFENGSGNSQKIGDDRLGVLLQSNTALRLSFLNACDSAQSSWEDLFTGTAQTLVFQGIPAVLAMRFPITDRAAIELSQHFYEAIADGLPVDRALAKARRQIYLNGNDEEWGTPILFSRSDDNSLLDVPVDSNGSTTSVESAVSDPQPTPDLSPLDSQDIDVEALKTALRNLPNADLALISYDLIKTHYEQLTATQSQRRKVNRLIEYCKDANKLETLAERIKLYSN